MVEGLAVWPLDPLELGPDRDQEGYDPITVMSLLVVLPSAALAARALCGQVGTACGLQLGRLVDRLEEVVVVAIELGLRRRVLHHRIAAAGVLRRRPRRARSPRASPRRSPAGHPAAARPGARVRGAQRGARPGVALPAGGFVPSKDVIRLAPTTTGFPGARCACRTSGSTCASRSARDRCASTSQFGNSGACTLRKRASRRFGHLRGPWLPLVTICAVLSEEKPL